jgi:proline iminopeptidase
MPAMDQKALAEIKQLEAAGKYEDPRYMELLIPNYYTQHLLRMPAEQWPEPVGRTFKHLNPKVYIPMQGPSEMGASGKLVKWDRSADLKSIAVPALVIAGQYDTMDPKDLEWMSHQFPKGRYLLCPKSGHLAEYDDPQTYFTGLIGFLKDVDAGKMSP